MTTQITFQVEANSCKINGVQYKLEGPIQRYLVRQYPSKIVIGDTARDSKPRTSSIALVDMSGGIGQERRLPSSASDGRDRTWWSTLDTSHPGHTVLARRADAIPKPSEVSGTDMLQGFGELGGSLYAVFARDVYRYDGASWTSSLHVLNGTFNSMTHVDLDGEDYIAIAHSRGVALSNDGDTWLERSVAD